MYAAPFEYHTASTVEEALELLTRLGEEAKLLAGGHSIIPLMKLRFAEPPHLIDIRRITELTGIREEADALVIGAATTHRTLETSALVRGKLPVLAEAAGLIGDPQVRNMGTLGGSLAHADPAADLPAVLLALEAQVMAVGSAGERSIPAHECFTGLMETALGPAEILKEVRFPLPPARSGAAYEKRPHPASRYALAGVAAVLTLDADGRVERARVGITGLSTRAVRAAAVEQAVVGAADDAALAAAAERAAEGLTLRADLQGPVAYKAQLARVYTERALVRARARAAAA